MESLKRLLLVIVLCVVVLPSEARRRKKTSPVPSRRELAAPEARRLSYLFQEGVKQKLNGHLSEAYDLFRHCLDVDAENADALFELGYLQFYLGEDSLGTAMLRHAVELDGRNPRYVQSLAAAYLSQNQYAEAIPMVERLSQLQPRRSDVLYQLMELYKADGKTDDAIRVLDRIELLDGRTLQTSLQKYALYVDKGEHEQAYAVLEDLERESPYDLRIPLIRGKQYLQNEEPERALECFGRVEKADPQNTELRMAMMDYYAQTGQKERRTHLRDSLLYAPDTPDHLRAQMMALLIDDLKEDSLNQHNRIMAALDTVIQLSPSALLYSLRVSYLMYAKADQATIAHALRELLTVDGTNENALSRLLIYYLDKRDMENAAEICRMGINSHPETLSFHFYLGVALSQLKQPEEAISVLQNGLKQVGEDTRPESVSDLYEVLGELYYEQGRTADAFAAYDSCLVYKDDNAACLNNYAYYLSLRGERLDEAERMAYRATKLEPLNKTYLDTYAWVLFMQGNYMMAKFYIDRVISPSQADSLLLADDDVHADVLEHAGDIYAQNEDVEAALRYWSLAMQKGEEKNALLEKKVKLRKYVKE